MISAKHLLPLVLLTGTLLHAVPNLEVNSAPDRWSAPFEVLDQPKGVYGEYRRAAESAAGALRFSSKGARQAFLAALADYIGGGGA